jgi:uncharacterized membrane protein
MTIAPRNSANEVSKPTPDRAPDAVANDTFTDDFRRFFVRGLGALVPTLLTFAILIWAYNFVNNYVGSYITLGLMKLCSFVRDEPAPWLLAPDMLLESALEYGQPLDIWNDEGQRLTVEYNLIRNHQVLEDRASASVSAVRPSVLSSAKRARNLAVWQIAFAKYKLHLLGFVLAIILVYFVGLFLSGFMGRAAWRGAERLLSRIPLIRAVYPSIKQITDFLFSERRVEFSGVVAAEYPRKGIWSVGLSTGAPMKHIQRRIHGDFVTVFIPSSPTPLTGYVITVPREDVIDLNLTIDEALRFVISGGVIKPDPDRPGMVLTDG